MCDDKDYGPEPNDQGVTLNAEVRVEWSNEAVMKAVIDQVSRMIYDDIKPDAITAVTTALNAQANQAISELFDTEVTLTDKWGKPTGPAINIRAMLQRDASAWLLDTVDSQGRKGRDGYGDRHQRIHWLFEEALNGKTEHGRRSSKTHLQKMVLAAVKEIIGDVESVVNATVREHVKKAMG